VYCAKPKSSRNSSVEAFVVCRGFRVPEGVGRHLDPAMGLVWPARTFEPVARHRSDVLLTRAR
jgi:tRNA (cytidine32/guanosine34-2'-O)-methyltransferase